MLTSLAQIKSFLNIPGSDSTQNSQLTGLQFAAETIITNRIKRNLEPSSYTEYYAGNSQRAIILRNRPVLSVQFVFEDFQAYYGYNPTSFGPTTLLMPGVHYTLDLDTGTSESKSGLLIRIGGVWMEAGRVYYPGKLASEIGPTYGNLKITYMAGFNIIPMDIQYAVCLLVSFMKRNVEVGSVLQSEKLGDYEYQIFDPRQKTNDPLLSSVDQILTRYREQSL